MTDIIDINVSDDDTLEYGCFLKSKLKCIHKFQVTVDKEEELFRRIFADDSLFFLRWHEKNGGSFDIKISNWEKENEKDMRRTQNFNIKVLLRTNECKEAQRWAQVSENQFVFEASNRIIGNSFSDFFSVEFRILFTFEKDGVCGVECSAGVHFTSEFPMSGRISSSVLSQFNESFPNMESIMKEYLIVSPIITNGVTAVNIDYNEPAIVVLENLNGQFLGVRENRIFFFPVLTRWVITRNSPNSFSIQHEKTGRYLGHNFFGYLVADATRAWPWEDFQIEAIQGTGRVTLISTNWNFNKGANIVQHERTGELMCSRDRESQQGVQLLIRNTKVPTAPVLSEGDENLVASPIQFVKAADGTVFRLVISMSLLILVLILGSVMWTRRSQLGEQFSSIDVSGFSSRRCYGTDPSQQAHCVSVWGAFNVYFSRLQILFYSLFFILFCGFTGSRY